MQLIKRLRRRPYRLGSGLSMTRITRQAAVAEKPAGPVYISPWMRDSVDQGVWEIFDNADVARRAEYWNPSGSAASGDAISFRDYIAAGTYTCKFLYRKGANSGILEVRIDGSTVMTVDMYDVAGPINNQVATDTGIVVSTSGVKTIQIIVTGKNDSSGAYYVLVQEMVFYRTA